ncbi:MAG: TadE/TadG family type IV pilus assembly protein [Planctomycetota bacterium]
MPTWRIGRCQRVACTANRGAKRDAVATAELAICLPVLLTLTLTTVDLCSIFFLRESVLIAAYEGSRLGINQGGTDAEAIARVREILRERDVEMQNSEIQFADASFDTAETLEHVTMIVTVPTANNLVAPVGLFNNMSVTARITMRKEFENQE